MAGRRNEVTGNGVSETERVVHLAEEDGGAKDTVLGDEGVREIHLRECWANASPQIRVNFKK